MSYVQYSGLSTPNEVLGKMAEYIKSRGYDIVRDVSNDYNIYDMSSIDGQRFVFKNRDNSYFIILRSANGTQIFGNTDDMDMSATSPDMDSHIQGIGMVVSEGYSDSARWYNQFRVPIAFSDKKTVHGAFLPVPTNNQFTYTLYCNNVTLPTDTIVFSLVKEDSPNNYNQCAHLIYADLERYDSWTGGALFSGSATRDMVKTCYHCFDESITADSCILPVLSSGVTSNTFVRVDIDSAVLSSRGNIRWASSGTDNVTGKLLSLPIRVGTTSNGDIPNYWYLQSHSRLDWGRNINTLNGVTVNMPIFASVLVDPDVLMNYAPLGSVSGVYFVSMLNMQTRGTYEISYPNSNSLCQVFSMGKRRGAYGFDGISIRQIDSAT